MIVDFHLSFYKEVLQLQDMCSQGPFLSFGFQDVCCNSLPNIKTLQELISPVKVVTLDFLDPRADLRYDMNKPVPKEEHEKYGCFFDIGNIEHVFDTRQCLENCLRMVKVGGYYFVHTCINGYFAHGLHVFNPEVFTGSVLRNGFELSYLKYTTMFGDVLGRPDQGKDVLLWLAARKVRPMADEFVCHHQGFAETSTKVAPHLPAWLQ